MILIFISNADISQLLVVSNRKRNCTLLYTSEKAMHFMSWISTICMFSLKLESTAVNSPSKTHTQILWKILTDGKI